MKRKAKRREGKVAGRHKVSAAIRVKEVPGQTLVEELGELVCQACRKTVTKGKKTTIANHCKGAQHLKAVDAFKKKQTREQVRSVCDGVLILVQQYVGPLFSWCYTAVLSRSPW